MTSQRVRQDERVRRVKPGSDRDFWIPSDGIDRDVITYEITRYLGQDALVRPGKNDVSLRLVETTN
jgi:hypothetical protein